MTLAETHHRDYVGQFTIVMSELEINAVRKALYGNKLSGPEKEAVARVRHRLDKTSARIADAR